MHANDREEVEEIYAGEIAAIVGLKNTTTGDTLCDPDKPIILEKITFPEPVIGIRIEPKTKADDGFGERDLDRKSTRLNSSHQIISYAVFCLKKKQKRSVQHMSHISALSCVL